jgi:ubiquinone/menaquinone biosynthesis C-methylase UbiE
MAPVSLSLDTPELAEHYERVSVDRQFRAGKQLVERLAIPRGARVLDLGTGTGLLAEYVANVVGPEGHVYAVDPLPLRIEIAKAKAKPNLSFSVDDAYALRSFADASFDVVYLNAVFHWFPEKRAPLRNIHRLLRSGGKLGITTGSKDKPNNVQLALQRVLARPAYQPHAQPRFEWTHRVSPQELGELLRETGFEVLSLRVEPNSTSHRDAEAAIAHSNASSFGNLLGQLPNELRERARHDIALELERSRTPEGIRQEGARIIAVAVKRDDVQPGCFALPQDGV